MNKSVIKIIFLTLTAALVYAGCAQKNNSGSFFVPHDEATAACLSCHESYAALAERTAEVLDEATGKYLERGSGWGNPHNSIHGGPVPCLTCHSNEWMPPAKEKGCEDPTGMARSSKICTACHQPQELYTEKDKYPEWDYKNKP